MSWAVSVQPVLVCACLAAGLLFDPMGFLRMALFCSVFHEAGHIIAYWIITGCFPPLQFRVGGIALKKVHSMNTYQENKVLAAGPLANFFLAGLLYILARHHASYGTYFLAAVSLCIGLYNLLPIGTLDGAKLLQNAFPASWQNEILHAERLLAYFLSGLTFLSVFFYPRPETAKMAAVLAAGYLWLQQFCTGL